jgi:hypothetical protein
LFCGIQDDHPISGFQRLIGNLTDHIPHLIDTDSGFFRLHQSYVRVTFRADFTAGTAPAKIFPLLAHHMPAVHDRRDSLTWRTLSAGVMVYGRQTIQISGNQQGEGAFAHPRRAGKNHGMRQTILFNGAPQNFYRAYIANKRIKINRQSQAIHNLATGSHLSSKSEI